MTPSIPQQMRAVLLTGHGGLERLVAQELPVPHPGPGEVLIRLGGAAVNNTDINLRVGWYSKTVAEETSAVDGGDGQVASDAGWTGEPLEFPCIQGADGAGTIAAVGVGVPTTRIGQRVLIDPILRLGHRTAYFGSDTAGSFAEYTTVPDRNAVEIHSPLSDPELASFPCSSLAALHMLSRARVGKGQRVLVTGASGGVGSAAVQWARARGADVTAIAAPEKAAALRAIGAKDVLNRQDDPLATLGPESIDVVIDVAGGPRFASLLAVLVPHGQYAVAGAIAGPLVALDLRTLYLKDLTLHGCTVPPPDLFGQLVSAIESNLIRPMIAARFDLGDLADAQALFLKKSHVGKIVLSI